MPPRNLRAALVLAAATVAVASSFWVLPLPLIAQSIGSLVASVAGFAVLTAIRIPMGALRAPPEAALGFVARRLRLAGLQVAEERGRLRTRIGPLLLLRFDARPTGEGCRVRYWVDLDPVGGTGYVLLLGAVLFLFSGLPALVVALRLWRFGGHVLDGVLPASGLLPEVEEVDATKVALVEALSECHRLAQEAFEATRAAYWDWQGIAVIAGALAGALLLFLAAVALPGSDPVQRVVGAVPFAAAGGVGVAAILGILTRWRVRPRLLRYRAWAERLRPVVAREISGAAPEAGGESSFETLMGASREVPGWIDARRRAGLSADLGTWSLFWIVLGWVVELSFIGAYQIATNPVVGVTAILASLPFVGALYLWWRWWSRRQRDAAARQLGTWNARFEALRARMEAYLQDL